MRPEGVENSRSPGHPLHESDDFSLVIGGPLFQLFLRAHLAGGHLELLRRRMIFLAGVAWLPLLVLSALEGHVWSREIRVPFLFDVETHVRFLVALPLLVVAEQVVNQRMRPVVRRFLERGLIPEGSRDRFEAAIESALRLRNSAPVEAVLLALVWGVGTLVIWRHYAAIDVTGWYGVPGEGGLRPSLAGWWLGWVSLPFFQFLLLRWYFRLFLWARFLWQVSRLPLGLVPTHPDGVGGLAFLLQITYAFSPLLAAQGAVVSGFIANRILFAGATLLQFKIELVSIVVVMLLVVLGPLLVFSPLLARTRRDGLVEYGTLAQRYVREFDQKWLRGGAPPEEPLIGSGDIQSLADLANSFNVVSGMRVVVFTMKSVVPLAVATLAPVAPLLLTVVPLDVLLKHALKMVF
jgi:hypothetical protein